MQYGLKSYQNTYAKWSLDLQKKKKKEESYEILAKVKQIKKERNRKKQICFKKIWIFFK